MRKLTCAVALSVVALGLSACQTQLYSWGQYDESMYAYTRDHSKQNLFEDELLKIIKENEQKGQKVPPGIYAEYGYQMLATGRHAEAIAFFEREEVEWPESKVLMDIMIERAGGDVAPKVEEEKSAQATKQEASL